MSTESNNEKSLSAGYAANMNGVAAVDRALSIIKVLQTAKKALTLTEIAESTGLYKSAILRMMASLENASLVVRRKDQRFVLGPFANLLGKAYESTMHLEEHLLPVMKELVEQGMESPSFHVRADGGHRLCLLRVDSNHSTLDRVRAGDFLPIDRGAAGKILSRALAGDVPESGSTVFEVSFGERDPACAAIAGPVFGPGQELIGALSLSGPMERFHDSSLHKMSPALLSACKKATKNLGGNWPISD